jgi:murein DD-endopeptidase MepM/ murein hydrolase activator NlpD
MRQALASLSILVVLAVGVTRPVFAATCWEPPVTAPVVDPYRPPACPWCPGNRGITFGTSPGAVVRAVAAGWVTFAGSVAGTLYLVVELGNGWRVTYGNLGELTVGDGDVVVAGMLLGHAAGAFHFGLRDRVEAGADAYLDPTPHLGVWRHRARLIPTDGAPAAPAPEPTLHCPGPGAAAPTWR